MSLGLPYRTKHILFILILFFLCACQSAPNKPLATLSSQCQKLFSQQEATLQKSHRYNRINKHLNLRINRFWSSFREELDSEQKKYFWLKKLQDMATPANHFLNTVTSQRPSAIIALEKCKQQLTEHYLSNKILFKQLTEHTRVKDHYNFVSRVLGLYPLTKFPILNAIKKWQEKDSQRFQKEPPSGQEYIFYKPEKERQKFNIESRGLILKKARKNNPFSIPLVNEKDLQILFNTFSPIWAIKQKSSADLIGQPQWTNNNIEINTDIAQVFQLPSYTRFNGNALLQLNYIIWFKSTPKTHALDLYGGKLDSIIWRVTLDQDGSVLLYDSIHTCGCYHRYYINDNKLKFKTNHTLQEPPLIYSITSQSDEQPITVQISSNEHYIVGVWPTRYIINQDRNIIYTTEDYALLHRLPFKEQYKSIFSLSVCVSLSVCISLSLCHYVSLSVWVLSVSLCV